MKIFNHMIVAGLLAGTAIAVPASAAPLVLGAGWTDDNLTNSTGASTGSPITFSILAGQQAYFRLTDAFLAGDVYTIRNSLSAALIGVTTFTTDGANVPAYQGVAWSDTTYSRFSILLGPGSYSYNVFYTSGTAIFPAGIGYRLDAVVPLPEPASWALMVAGFGAVGFAMRRRQKVRTTVSFA